MQTLPVCWVLRLRIVQTGSEEAGEGQWLRKGWERKKIAQGKSSRGWMQSKHLPGHLRLATLPFSQMLNSKIGFHSGFEGENYP